VSRGASQGLVLHQYGDCVTRVSLPAALFEVRKFDWRNLHEGSFVSQSTLLELTRSHAKGGYVREERDWQALGEIRLFHKGREFFSRWLDDEQTSLYCAIDMPTLASVELDLDERRLREACNVRNRYLHSLLSRTERELRQPGFASRLILESHSFAIAAELLQHFSSPLPRMRSRGEEFGPRYIQNLASRFREEGEPPALECLAKEEGLGTRQFARLFKAAAGETIGAFCARQIIWRSKDLLADPTLLIKMIAFQCGFASTASFSRAFYRAVGMSPQDYRKSLGMNEPAVH
jgi:AraC family transcriptional regulator